MKNNSLIILVIIALLGGVGIWGTRHFLSKDEPSSYYGGIVSPTNTSHVRFSASPSMSSSPVVLPSTTMRHITSRPTHTPSHSVGGYGRTAAPLSFSSGSSAQGMPLGYRSSSATIRSIGGGTTNGGSTSRMGGSTASSRQSAAGISTGITTLPTPTYTRRRPTDNNTDNSTSTTFGTAAPSASRAPLIGPFASTSEYISDYYNPLPAGTQYQTQAQTFHTYTTRRRAYTGSEPTDGNGNYWDEEAESWLPIPGSTPQVGDTKIEGGYLWTWNGTEWIKGASQIGDDDPDPSTGPSTIYDSWLALFIEYNGREPNDDAELDEFIKSQLGTGIYTGPMGDGLWLLLLMIAGLALSRLARHRTEKNNTTL